MGKGKVSNSRHNIESKNNQTNVVLNVYDLTPINKYSYWIGFGIFHSGFEVHGKEYGFGAHDFLISGVFQVELKNCPGFAYRCSISLGTINMASSEFRALIEKIASEYHGNTYHLISKNCNHFTSDLVHKLTGKKIPGWINRLARLGALFSCLLPKSLQVTKVKKMPEHLKKEDGIETLSNADPNDSSQFDDTEQEKRLTPKHGNFDTNFVKQVQLHSKKTLREGLFV